MIRNIKVMGLALIAVLALSAVATASAQAGKLTSTGPVTLTGTLTGAASANAFVGFGGETTCAKASYTAHKYNVTPHIFIPSGESSFTVTPNYGTCSYKNGPTTFIVTVNMNGCDYAIHLEEQVGLFEFKAKTTINCTAGKHITVTLFTTAGEHAAGNTFCHFTITEKAAGYPGLIATDTANGKVDINGTVAEISADKKSPTGSLLCVEEVINTGKQTLDFTLEGKSEKGLATGISLS